MRESGDNTLKKARDNADRVQMRIIREKLADNQELYPDEEEVLARYEASTSSKHLTFKEQARNVLEFYEKSHDLRAEQTERIMERLPLILAFSAMIKENVLPRVIELSPNSVVEMCQTGKLKLPPNKELSPQQIRLAIYNATGVLDDSAILEACLR